MNSQKEFSAPCFRVEQPLGGFYVCIIDHEKLLEICYSDVRGPQKQEHDEILGIQRPLSKKRVKDLQEYVRLVDATFPTSIILAVRSSDVEYDPVKKEMSFPRRKNVAKVIDGQHRLAGLEALDPSDKFELSVTVFVDMSYEDQALVFSTINLTHTKVSKSLSYDLLEYANHRSPQKTCHDIVRLLNSESSSPFYKRIKVLGSAVHGGETITQAAIIDRILPYFSSAPVADRDRIKRHKSIKPAGETQSAELIFRNLFIAEKDGTIARIISEFFSSVSDRWPTAWNEVRQGHILNRTTGLDALLRFMRPAYVKLTNEIGAVVSASRFLTLLEMVKVDDDHFHRDTYPPGSAGQSLLYKFLLQETGLEQ